MAAPKAAHHKTTVTKNIITVKEGNNTYLASLDGEKASNTCGAENAARTLAAKLWGIPHAEIKLEKLPDDRKFFSRFQIVPTT